MISNLETRPSAKFHDERDILRAPLDGCSAGGVKPCQSTLSGPRSKARHGSTRGDDPEPHIRNIA